MTQEYQPTSNFFLDFNRSFQTNILEFDPVYDSGGTTGEFVDSFAFQLSQTNGYASTAYAHQSTFYQSVANEFQQRANQSLLRANAGNVIHQNIFELATQQSNYYSNLATQSQSLSQNAGLTRVTANFLSEWAGRAGTALAVVDIVDKAYSAPDGDQATIDALRATSGAVAGIAAGHWGVALGLGIVAGLGLVGLPAILVVAGAAAGIGYVGGKIGESMFDGLLSSYVRFADMTAAAYNTESPLVY